jgi:hypothetical protein
VKKSNATPQRSLRIGDDVWAEIGRRAEASGEDRTAYVVRRALEVEPAELAREVARLRRRLEQVSTDLGRLVGEQEGKR